MTENSTINFYTYFPYAEEQCGNVKPKLLGSCDSSLPMLNLYPPKVPMNFHGCQIRLLAFYYQPYVINPYSSKNPGLEVVMMNEFGKAMNFTPIYVNHKLTHTGYKFARGVYSELYRMLYNYEGEIMFGSLKVNSTFNEEFDSSYTHMRDDICWYAPKAHEVAPWKHLLIVFQKHVWFILLCVMCVTALFWRLMSYVVDQYYYNQTLHCLTNVWYSLLLGSVRQPRGSSMRLTFISWVMGTFLISTMYQTMFTSILTNPVYGKQISNMEEMLESHIDYGFDSLAAGEFKFPQDKTLWTIYNNYIPCPFHLAVSCINRTIVAKNFVLAKNRKNMAYFLKHNYSYLGGRSAVYEFEAYKYYLRVMVNQGFPLLESLNTFIRRIQNCGLFMKWNSDLIESLHLKLQDKGKVKQLTVEHLQAAFYILAFGCVIGFIVFIIELLSRKLK
ncbi:Ionotropic receptor 60a [Carabus blaptoides fortunei]